MNKVIKLGNIANPKNDIPIKDDTVSYNHLEIIWIGNNKVKITDLGSSHGTNVNGNIIKSKTITPNDKIEIGRNNFTGAEIINKVRAIVNKDKIRFYDEFEALKPIFKEYQKRLKKLSYTYRTKVYGLRSLIILGALLLFIAFKDDLGIPEGFRVLVFALGGILATFLAEKLFSKADLKLRQKELVEEFMSQIACPKCSYSLIRQTYNYWKKKRKCPKCQANWVK